MSFCEWHLRTVFFDNGGERSGPNIRSNIELMMDFARNPQPLAVGDGLDSLYGRLRSAALSSANERPAAAPSESDVSESERHATAGKQSTALCNDEVSSGVGSSSSLRRESTRKKKLTIKRVSMLRTVTSTNASSSQVAPKKNEVDVGASSLQGSPVAPVAPASLSVKGMLRSTAPLAAVVRGAQRRRASIAAEERCPHCRLRPQDPLLYQVPVNSDGRRKPDAPFLRYGNLTLGITDPAMALEQLWLAVAKLHMSQPFALSVDQCVNVVREHFIGSVGVPPWIEDLISQQRHHRRVALTLANEVHEQEERNAELKNELGRLQRSLQVCHSLRGNENHEEDRVRLVQQLHIARAELADKTWLWKETVRKNERDSRLTDIHAALVAFRTEEAQRYLASIGSLYRHVGRQQPHKVKLLDIPQRLQRVLRNAPSTEFGKSTRRMMEEPASAAVNCTQCRDCLLLLISSPYCPVTGLLHTNQLDDEAHAADAAAGTQQDKQVLSSAASPVDEDTELLRCIEEAAPQAPEPPRTSILVASSSRAYHTTSRTMVDDRDHRNSTATNDSDHATSEASTTPAAGLAAVRSGDGGDPVPLFTSSGSISEEGHVPLNRGSAVGVNVQTLAVRTDSTSKESGHAAEQLHARSDPIRNTARQTDVRNLNPALLAMEGFVFGSDERRSSDTIAGADTGGSVDRSNSQAPTGERSSVTFTQEVARTTRNGGTAKRDALALCAAQTRAYLEAASRMDFAAMRRCMEELGGPTTQDGEASTDVAPGELALRFPVISSSLLETEERFFEWYYAINLGSSAETPQQQPTSTGAREAKSAVTIRLRKELRDLQNALAKRPNTRHHGFVLDDDTFIAVAARINDLEKKVQQLRAKTRGAKAMSGARDEVVPEDSPQVSANPVVGTIISATDKIGPLGGGGGAPVGPLAPTELKVHFGFNALHVK